MKENIVAKLTAKDDKCACRKGQAKRNGYIRIL